MCWVSNKTPVLQIAEQNIKTYKILKQFKGYSKVESPLYPFVWEFNKEYFNPIGWSTRYFTFYEITEGFHSLKCKPYIKENRYCRRGSTECIMFTSDRRKIFECTIPKGSRYYENETGDIVSEKLIINKLCE